MTRKNLCPFCMRTSVAYFFVSILMCLISELCGDNLKEITKLVALQEKQLANPIDSKTSNEIKVYNICVHMMQKELGTINIFAPRYKFGTEDINYYELQCLCNPDGYSIQWTKISIENTKTVIAHRDGITESTRLGLGKVEPQLSIYYCSWKFGGKEIINKIWLVEIVPTHFLEKVSAVSWNEPLPYVSESHNLIVSHFWEIWSSCNRCHSAGKRHRFGYCHVNSTSTAKSDWSLLNILPSVSCSALLTYHPEIGQIDQDLTEELMKSCKIMIGFCKTPCTYKKNFDAELNFEQRVPKSIRQIYLKEVIVGDNEDYDMSNDFKRNIPIFISYFPEFVLVVIIVGLQLWIVIQICKNKINAK